MLFKYSVIHMPPKNTNSVLVDDGCDAVIFDPWGAAADWLNLLRERNLNLKAIFCTHGHFDHISAISGLMDAMNATESRRSASEGGWFIHPADIPVVEWSNPILKEMGMMPIDLKKIPPRPIAAGNVEILPGLTARVIHTPGHSAGGICFYFNAGFKTPVLIAGDTLFQKEYGRTDLPTGDARTIRESLALLYRMNFPDNTMVIHGHGGRTTIGWLKQNNAYFR